MINSNKQILKWNMNMGKKLYLFVLLVFFFIKAGYNVYGEDQPRNFKQLSISEQRELFAKRWNALQKMQQQDNGHDELKKTIIEGNQILYCRREWRVLTDRKELNLKN